MKRKLSYKAQARLSWNVLSFVSWDVAYYAIIEAYNFVSYFEFWAPNVCSPFITSSTKLNHRAWKNSLVKEMTVHLKYESVKLFLLTETQHNQRKLEILFKWHFLKGTHNKQSFLWVIFVWKY